MKTRSSFVSNSSSSSFVLAIKNDKKACENCKKILDIVLNTEDLCELDGEEYFENFEDDDDHSCNLRKHIEKYEKTGFKIKFMEHRCEGASNTPDLIGALEKAGIIKVIDGECGY